MSIATAVGIGTGLMGATGSLMSASAEKQQQRQQASALEAQAALREQTGAIEAQNIDARKSQLRREFQKTMSHNAVQAGAGNVDLSGGSTAQVAAGNIDAFANDIGENYYQKRLKEWEARESASQDRWQASQLEKSAANLGPSLLSAGLAAGRGFMDGYKLAGGSFSFGDGGGAAAGAQPAGKFWDRALLKWQDYRPRH